MLNARQSHRVNCSIPVLLQIPEFKVLESWGVIYDISLGGVKIETPTELNKDQKLYLSFVVARKFHFKKLEGVVTRVLVQGHSYSVGIKFDSKKDKVLLSQAIVELINLGGIER